MKLARYCWTLLVLCLIAQTVAAGEATTIKTNRKLEVIKPSKELRGLYRQAGKLLGDWTIVVSGMEIDGPRLVAISNKSPGEPFVRVVREDLRIPVDVDDFVYFLDDVLREGKKGLRGKQVWVLPGRARAAGLLVHPDDVFRKNRPRVYGKPERKLAIDRPVPQPELSPAKDGDPLGPNWVTRYQNPVGDQAKLAALEKTNPSGTLAKRVDSLLRQLREQGCEVGLYTTVRNRRRGYLMYGAYTLSKLQTRPGVRRTVRKLKRMNRAWGLNVQIRWAHPQGWRATIEAARKMADAYPVTYATAYGARKSKHYDSEAVDLGAYGLPRRLTLKAPDGEERVFDLSAPYHNRDINLTPELIKWIEWKFQMEKLKFDYPHWNDTAKPSARQAETP
jgi:hypothetical protein